MIFLIRMKPDAGIGRMSSEKKRCSSPSSRRDCSLAGPAFRLAVSSILQYRRTVKTKIQTGDPSNQFQILTLIEYKPVR